VHGNANLFGRVEGNVATVDGDIVVHPGAVVTGDVLAVSGVVRDEGGDIQGRIGTGQLASHHPRPEPRYPVRGEGSQPTLLHRGAGLAGTLFSLLLVGFGLVLFARPPLEVMSDTALHSFGRSFLVGLLAQILVLPTFGALIVGLVLTVAGILLVPFVTIAFAMLMIAAVLGGFLAVAHAMGETVTRRQLARGLAISYANSYRYMLVGLASIAALWLAWVIFGWVPVAGSLILVTAALITWLLATVGFGASLLSRAGLREHFAGRLIAQESLTDEYLWATPQFGVSAVKRPEQAGSAKGR
jgi:MFS family permease